MDIPDTIKKLLNLIEFQMLEEKQYSTVSKLIDNANNIHEFSNRVVELFSNRVVELKYSRKLCLMFVKLEYGPNPLSDVLQLLRNHLKINLIESNIAACHRFSSNPKSSIIVYFVFHADRNTIWRRKSWLKSV